MGTDPNQSKLSQLIKRLWYENLHFPHYRLGDRDFSMCWFDKIWEFLGVHWGAIIATLVFIVASLTLYYLYVKPFAPRIYNTGRYSLSVSPSNQNEHAISLGLNFANDGAKNGVIKDIVINIRNDDGFRQYFVPLFEIGRQPMNFKKDLAKELEAFPFEAFEVKGKEVKTKKIMLIPHKGAGVLPIGEFKVDIYARTSKNDNYLKFDDFTMNIDREDISTISLKEFLPPTGGFVSVNFRDKVTNEMLKNWDQFVLNK